MTFAKIVVTGVSAHCVESSPIPAGLVGGTVQIKYTDPVWKDLQKTVVFRCFGTRDVITNDTTVTIPHEVLAKPNMELYVGVEGRRADGTLVIPTIEAHIGIVLKSANPSGDLSTDPTPPVWQQILALIGDLDGLTTEARDTLVAAINEAVDKEGAVDEQTVWDIVDKYRQENPPERGPVGPQGEQGPQGEKGDKGDKGDPGADGKPGANGADGENGRDGISVTHAWIGTTLRITSASGSTSADLKGDKGDPGDQGPQGSQGPKGPQGDNGTPATLVSSAVVYQVSTSGTAVPTGTWRTYIPNTPQGSYLWTRTTLVFNTGDPVVCYSVARMGADGTGAIVTVNGLEADSNGNLKLTATNVNALSNVGGDLYGELRMNSHPIRELEFPTEDDQAASKGYVDSNFTQIGILWENASPTSTFASRSISLDLSGSKGIFVIFKAKSAVNAFTSSGLIPVGDGNNYSTYFISDSGPVFKRACRADSQSVYFADAGQNGTEDNTLMIPAIIYGVK